MPHQTTTLYITQLDERVTENMLKDIFSMISPVHHVKINTQNQSGLVEFHERRGAEQVLHTMDGRIILGQKIHIQWSNQTKKHHYYTIHVYGLGQDITSSILKSAFQSFSPIHVEVMADHGTIDFETKQEAEQAMKEMNGQTNTLGQIQCYWANHHILETLSSPYTSRPSTPPTPSFSNTPMHPSTTFRVTSNNRSYEQIFAQTPPYNTSVYVKNLPTQVSEQDLVSHFQQYGYVSHIEMDEYGATVTLDTHANASTAIFALQGFDIQGQPIELEWAHENEKEQEQEQKEDSYYSMYQQQQDNQWRFQPIHGGYYDLLMMRPPAPVAGSPYSAGGKAGQAIHGWNQYYQNYYSAGHQSI
ncbi:uncharacterized protein BX664DRAFT_388856 [Halteromyces radiatus]|uniref:uncharacterized protein n=1 Tax=Halteromyces radiatus TaxID=101107 RepID=UPI00221F8010|nr:uncharacterized protein BX664DRAFT_388856 [Halteromyces radiatus]KAI8079887.1 hypothetical protein BX664DRAFT_388856 [Halteromyces radiatus]